MVLIKFFSGAVGELRSNGSMRKKVRPNNFVWADLYASASGEAGAGKSYWTMMNVPRSGSPKNVVPVNVPEVVVVKVKLSPRTGALSG